MQNPQSKLAETKYSVPTSQHGAKFSRKLRYVVVHTAECCSGKPRSAYNLAKWLSGGRQGSSGKGSWHYNVDADYIVQSLDERYVGYHVGNTRNNDSLGIEMCVYHSHNKDEWLEGYRWETVKKTAELTRDLCERHSVPMRGLTATEARAGKAGVISHSLARTVWGGRSVRLDPGRGFPWQKFMDMVRSGNTVSPVVSYESFNSYQSRMYPRTWVTAAYQHVLGRKPDLDGMEYWQEQLKKIGPEKVFEAIKASKEASK